MMQRVRMFGVSGARKNHPKVVTFLNGTLETTRTFDPLLRRQMLYPAELRGQFSVYYVNKTLDKIQVFFEHLPLKHGEEAHEYFKR